jgi:hypothetical protein
VVSAAALTVYDVLEQGADSLLTNPLGLIEGGGLRGGRFHETRHSIRMRNVVLVPGVRVSGDITDRGVAILRVAGSKSVRGHLRIRGNRVAGAIGGRRVSGAIHSIAKPATAVVARVSSHLKR